MKKSITYLLIGLFLASCVELKNQSLWDNSFDNAEPKNINHFYAINILTEGLSSEVWFTENKKCIEVYNATDQVYGGKKSIKLKWNKKDASCDWIGLGIGWDAWTGKDLTPIINDAAIEFRFLKPKGRITSLPLAAALEDYGGKQAWLGFLPDYISQSKSDRWATVRLPLNKFSWKEFNADFSNVKQLIIQFEASGEVYLDEIKLVPFESKKKKHYNSLLINSSSEIKIDGVLNEQAWKKANHLLIGGNKIQIVSGKSHIYISGNIKDNTPLKNTQTKEKIWDGDAIELAFSSNKDANHKRSSLLFSDQHLGIRISPEPYVWNWRTNSEIADAVVQIIPKQSGYYFEAKIPYSALNISGLNVGCKYGLEVAIDMGDRNSRKKQIRWNSQQKEGFHKNPSMWGEMHLFNENTNE